mmetsp:Transcript_9194/g.13496  ORF Transcript_9194/g.13496 Transcript_9194/m.13496 type:complete len:262 (-) Transcript_9194:123-908(-)
MGLCERTHINRIIDNERWLDEVGLTQFLKACIENISHGREFVHLWHSSGHRGSLGLLQRFGIVEVEILKVKVWNIFLHDIIHRHAPPWTFDADRVLAIRKFPGITDRIAHGYHKLFRQIHHIIVVSVCLVKLNRGKFRIMTGRNPLVTKDTPNFIDTIEATNDQPLQMQFCRDAKRQIHVHGVMIGLKRLSLSTPRLRMQDGRFNLQKSHGVEFPSEGGGDDRALAKGFPHVRVDNEVKVTISVPFGDIGEAVPFVREGCG